MVDRSSEPIDRFVRVGPDFDAWELQSARLKASNARSGHHVPSILYIWLGLCFGMNYEVLKYWLWRSISERASAIRSTESLGPASRGQPLGEFGTANQGQHLEELRLVVELSVQQHARGLLLAPERRSWSGSSSGAWEVPIILHCFLE